MMQALIVLALFQHAHRAPRSPLEYVIVFIAAVVTAYVLVLAVKWTMRPGEDRADHIKRTILEDEPGRNAASERDHREASQLRTPPIKP